MFFFFLKKKRKGKEVDEVAALAGISNQQDGKSWVNESFALICFPEHPEEPPQWLRW